MALRFVDTRYAAALEAAFSKKPSSAKDSSTVLYSGVEDVNEMTAALQRRESVRKAIQDAESFISDAEKEWDAEAALSPPESGGFQWGILFIISTVGLLCYLSAKSNSWPALLFAIALLLVGLGVTKSYRGGVAEECKKRMMDVAARRIAPATEVLVKLRGHEAGISALRGIHAAEIKQGRELLEKSVVKARDEEERARDEMRKFRSAVEERFTEIWKERAEGCPEFARNAADAWLVSRNSWVNGISYNAPSTAAELKRRLTGEIREVKRSEIVSRNLVIYYESLFPWLEEFRDEIPETALAREAEIADTDARKNWVKAGEWKVLSESERSQLSLNRFLGRSKTKWEIGIEYERFIGHELESEGWSVVYHGAIRGLDDLGRDLVARKGPQTLVVQCKRWSAEKQIHEKHVFQTYGTVIAMQIDEPNTQVSGRIVTSARLSDRAKKFATALGLDFQEQKQPGEFPRIKCNAKSKQGQVYHLPFDQQYDAIIMRPQSGDFYCTTVEEAEAKGFRRAMRWLG